MFIFIIEPSSNRALMNPVHSWRNVMTMNAIEHRPGAPSDADTNDLHETVEFMTGFIETVRIVGLRMAGLRRLGPPRPAPSSRSPALPA
jgi:hypothetical protein